jgi:hypothetical protein
MFELFTYLLVTDAVTRGVNVLKVCQETYVDGRYVTDSITCVTGSVDGYHITGNDKRASQLLNTDSNNSIPIYYENYGDPGFYHAGYSYLNYEGKLVFTFFNQPVDIVDYD